MKKIIIVVGLAVLAGLAQAQTYTTNLFPNGNFDFGGPTGDWLEVGGGGGYSYEYPTSGGNPDSYGIIHHTNSWAIWVNGAADPGVSLASMGLVAGNTYTFVQDMKTLAGTNTGGLKLESWGPAGKINDTGDMRPATWSTNGWSTYTFTYTIAPAATGIKVVPLWGERSSVGFDNLGVVVPVSLPLNAQITNPTNGASVSTNFLIVANASVAPGNLINVDFYLGETLLGSDYTAPYSWNVTGYAPANSCAHAILTGRGWICSPPSQLCVIFVAPASHFTRSPLTTR